MNLARTCARAFGVCIVGLTGVATAQPVLFTGDAEADFGPNAVVIDDPGGIDVGVPLAFPLGTVSGNDIKDLRLSYDAVADVMYVGFNMYAIATDVDSQAGPDVTGPVLLGLGGVDSPRVGGTEAFALLVDVDEDGTTDVIIGVSGETDIDGFTTATFGGSPFAPGLSFAGPLPVHTGAVAGTPSALLPDIEFTVPNWSALPTSSGGDLTAQFAVTGFVGSFSDAGIGEDFTPGVNQFAPVCFAQPETCNNIDDDCDGEIDEGFDAGAICNVGVGTCAAVGVRVCLPDGTVECTATQGDPSPETCNALDDDCDGATDEGIGGSQCTTDLPGVCVDGQLACEAGQLNCNPVTGPGQELCDNADNDCDGTTDEGFVVGARCDVGVGACRVGGVTLCDAEGGVRCSGTPNSPNPETCDALDNDCDGQSDEGYGLGDACSAGTGACANDGLIACDGQGGSACSAIPGDPAAESCNGLDDDCDSVTDEGTSGGACNTGADGVCANGSNECVGGALVCQGENQPGAEVCDTFDNDCDGQSDEGFHVGEPCQEGVGACRSNGVVTCDANGGETCSATVGEPGVELCDAIDNDCDGQTDEGFGLGAACSGGVGACAVNGEYICDGNGGLTCSAQPGEGGAETCNGLDDDCDGQVDEGLGLGEICTAGIGACQSSGITVCGDNAVVCDAQPGQPEAEVCDNNDNDCDGELDEGLGLGEGCETGVGECNANGVNVCDGLGGVTCNATSESPKPDVCNGLDDDCDGSSDEKFGLGEPCSAGIGACMTDGEIACDGTGGSACNAEAGDPNAEVCDGLDNDCDGTIDEGTGGANCDSGEPGACGPGTTACVNGALNCEPSNQPGAETCNDTDDDCDGNTDEGFGIGEVCEEGVGACASNGVTTCNAAGGAECSATPGDPQPEACDALDNDCDGTVDEKTGGDACDSGEPGACGPGTTACVNGALSCEPGNQPGAETCNHADDDCDGNLDEGTGAGAPCQIGVGQCMGNGVNVCDADGGVECSATQGDPQPETCDGADNDCDGNTDEGFGLGDVCNAGQGACGTAGEIVCDGNGGATCDAQPGEPGAEVCDNADNDCDGQIDEGLGLDDVCTVGVGACQSSGVAICDGNGGVTCDAQPGQPEAEVCDMNDNDCDGAVDEGLGLGDACNAGVGVCAVAGEIICDGLGGVTCNANPLQPQAETCDNADNDCDGSVDEGTGAGEACHVGVGICAADGVNVCTGDGGVQCAASQRDPRPETCDGSDEDCDGNTDEGTGGDACDSGVPGACGPGTTVCVDGAAVCEPGQPGVEVCDSADNDCDGTIDEGTGAGEVCHVGVGICAAEGVNVCTDDGGVQCAASQRDPRPETCDGADEDCDGTVDEGTGGDACESGVPGICGPGTTACIDGAAVCQPGQPGVETCDAVDNDCDGDIDEGTGAGEACQVGVGVCAGNGVNVCDANGGVECSATQGDPRPETCDGADEDCDGTVDEGTGGDVCDSGEPGACGPGTTSCVNGAAVCLPGSQPGAEVCDGADNDCDGNIDEGTGAGEACQVGVGVCAGNGVNVCDGNGGVECSATQGDPRPETCDGSDEDCDGNTDEGLGGDACNSNEPGACGPGTTICANGAISCEPGAQPGVETCDGIDNDCDGNTDEGTGGEACNSGLAGVCGPGTTACVNGAPVCEPGVEPGVETCNATDDDCDGSIDEGFNVGSECEAGVGACNAVGTLECDANGGVMCTGNPYPAGDEVCNGIDDDCDGSTDEGLGLGEACNVGVGACAADGELACGRNGAVVCDAEPGAPGAETCDGIDNDCDGNTDEGTGGEACNSGLAGVCGPGTTACVNGAPVCEPGVEPGVETCNATDDDCDGSIDEGFNVGSECEAGVGACNAVGTLECDANGGVMCTGNPYPAGDEVCNGIDDDCDGSTDEGLGLGEACNVGVGACAADGELACGRNGAVVCDAEPGAPGAETCNAADDDCDGSVDEGFNVGSECEAGVGACNAVGTLECDAGGGVMCTGNPYPAGDEVCNDVDDDCDGSTDEGLGLGDACNAGVGACAVDGEMVCGRNGAVVCNAEPGAPGAETCDGTDNDCDGSTDEDLGLGDACNVGVGACGNDGETVCDGNGGVTCDAEPGAPNAEACNNADDDCDGSTDEGLGLGERCSEGVGACLVDGVSSCADDGTVTCSATPGDPAAETCDTIDNDCDGSTDEGLGLGERCDAGEGACAASGETVCGADGDVICNAEPGQPAAETCDALDNDCDASSDEGLGLGEPCSIGQGACAADGENICDGNGGVTCSADPVDPGVETCDGVDNDCDGSVDEGFGVGDACNEGQGACAAVGTIICDGSGGATCDAEPAQPGAELCDDMDNDCDGFTDEGFGVGERCSAGQGVCRNIGERVCDANGGVLCDAEAGAPSDELCDEEDNDCDGLIDEDFDLDGDCSVGLGECKRDGQRICGEDDVVAGLGGNLVLNGSFENPELNRDWAVFQEIQGWTTISGNGIEIQRISDAASGEQYVELDSHPTPGGGCMMQQIPVDIGGIYRLSISHSARPNVGDNRVALYWDGVEVAELDADGRGQNNTVWTRYEYDVTGNSNTATLVICDVTNDRDTLGGFVDDVAIEMVEGIMCDADPGEPVDERCDALDNDCDGYIDEDLGIGDECQVGVGACANVGAQQCDADGEVICAGRAGDPVDEACDEVDNDCDGIVDEGVCDEEPPCEGEAPGTRVYQVTAWDDEQYGLYLPNWNEANHRTDMLFRDGATFTVRADGTATLTGTAFVNNLGGGAGQLDEEWAVSMQFELRGTGAEFGGPYRERPEVQPVEVTDLWTYFNLTGGTFTRGDVVATLAQYPDNGNFPFQMGQWANGRSDTFGASNWYRWSRNNADGSVSNSIGDMNINLDEICVTPEECEPQDEVCNDADDDCDGDVDEGLDCGGAPVCPQVAVLDFETDAEGNAIDAGRDLSDAYAAYGAHLTTSNRAGNTDGLGIAFDSANPTGGDPDLGTPNQDFGGPGRGNGGQRGREGENANALGNLLVRAENTVDNNNDGHVDVPDDHGQGARFDYTFENTVCVYGVDLVDIEDNERGASFEFFDANGARIDIVLGGGLGNNSYEHVDLDVCGVQMMRTTLIGSGAIDNIEFCIDPNAEPPICEAGSAFSVSEYSANGHAFVFPNFDGDNRTVKMHLRDDARFTIRGDDAVLSGTAFRTDNGDEYTVDVRFVYRGQGAEFGGPKIERPQWQTDDVTALWRYFDMTEATLMHDGVEVVTLTQMPADGRYPLQVGMTANGKNQGMGMSSWYTWIRENPQCRYNGTGDINVNLQDACE